MKKFAYLDEYGIMHITDDVKTANENADGKVVETEIKDNAGYPAVGDDKFFYYAKEGKLFKNHNRGSGNSIDIKEAPHALQELIKQFS